MRKYLVASAGRMAPALDAAELQDEFALFGIDIDSNDIVEKLKEIAATHCYDVTRIVNCWMAFSKSNEDLPMNMDNLVRFDRDLATRLTITSLRSQYPYVKKLNGEAIDTLAIPESPHSKVLSKTPQTPSSSGSKSNRSFATPIVRHNETDEFMEAYGTPASRASKKRLQGATPEIAGKRLLGARGAAAVSSAGSPVIGRAGGNAASPVSAAPSPKYQQRVGAGEVLLTYGSARGQNRPASRRLLRSDVTQYDSSSALVAPFKYMFQRILDQCVVINKNIDVLSERLKSQLGIQADEFASVADVTQDDVTVVGMVVCDSNGKLNDESVLLHGCKKYSPGAQAYPISLHDAVEFSLFPGQVVALKGRNPDGKKFLAREVHTCKPPPTAELKADELNCDDLSVVIAAGSFTTSDSLAYEPLQDLCRYIVQHRPDACFLIGPFLDPSNAENEKLGVSYDENFNNKINWLMERTEGLPTLIVVVASHRDLHHDFVYPTSPYRPDSGRRQDERLLFVSDPSTLSIRGMVFGMTSVDVLFHLSGQELSRNPSGGDRLSRLLHHVLSHQTYYPLYPPHDDVNLDLEYHQTYGHLPVTPHVLIMPSDLKYFIKEVDGCICINPGRLAKGQTGGSFAHFVVSPVQPNANQEPATRTLESVCTATIMRI